MFGADRQPAEIAQMKAAARAFCERRDFPTAFENYLRAMENLTAIATSRPPLISFHDIFESYRQDAELADLVSQLVETLEKVIVEADGSLTSRLERELTKLLAQLQNRDKLSILELGILAEVVAKFALEVVGSSQGIPACSLLYDVAEKAWKVWRSVGDKVQEGQREFVRMIDLRSVSADMSKWPQLDFKEPPSDIKKLDSGSAEMQ